MDFSEEHGEPSRRTVAALQGLNRRGDTAVGRILAALEKAGRAEDTIVLMNVDHGVGLPRAKTTCYDPGIATLSGSNFSNCVLDEPRAFEDRKNDSRKGAKIAKMDENSIGKEIVDAANKKILEREPAPSWREKNRIA